MTINKKFALTIIFCFMGLCGCGEEVSLTATVIPSFEECFIDLTIHNRTDAPIVFSNLLTEYYADGKLVLGTTHHRVSPEGITMDLTQQDGEKPHAVQSEFTITAPPAQDRKIQVGSINSVFCRSSSRRMVAKILRADGTSLGPFDVTIQASR